jgi:hypothetical protein
MALDPTLIQEVQAKLEAAFNSGVQQGQVNAEAAYFGKSARVLTGTIFAAAFQTASQALRPHDIEAANFFMRRPRSCKRLGDAAAIQSEEPSRRRDRHRARRTRSA